MRERSGESRAAERARWLAELAEAIDQAQRLLWSLADTDLASAEARALYGQLEAVRSEIELLRRAAIPHDDDQLDDIGHWLAAISWSAIENGG